MRTTRIKSYYEIEAEDGKEASHNLYDQDCDWMDENYPQLVRSFQVVHIRLDEQEKLIEFLKNSLLKLNLLLGTMASLTGDYRNETKH